MCLFGKFEKYNVMKVRVILASALLAASVQAMAQSSGTFSGTVVDENGEPVIGA